MIVRSLQLLTAIVIATQLAACEKTPPPFWQGYVEGEYLYLSAPQAGYLKTLDAARGTRVSAG